MKESNKGSCLPVLMWASFILSLVLLVGGSIFAIHLYKKVDTMHKWSVERQFGTARTFDLFFDATMTPEVKDKIEAEIKEGLEQMKSHTNQDSSEKEDGLVKKLTAEEMDSIVATVPAYQDKKSNILILEYADLNCGACKYLHDSNVLAELSSENDDVSVRFVSIPLRDRSKISANGAYCAANLGGADAYYKYVDAVFENPIKDEVGASALIKSLGLDDVKFMECMKNTETSTLADKNLTLATKLFSLDSTPTNIVLNKSTGSYIIVSGAASKASFEDAIQQVK